jgi:hypothetical protein
MSLVVFHSSLPFKNIYLSVNGSILLLWQPLLFKIEALRKMRKALQTIVITQIVIA